MYPRVSSSLEVSFAYDQPTRILTAHVLQAKEVPERDNGAASNSQVSLSFTPISLRCSFPKSFVKSVLEIS